MTVIILTEGGRDVGLGHLTRCISLYDEVEKRGLKAELIISGNVKSIDILKGKNYKIKDWYNKIYLNHNITKSDYTIVDSYKANREIYDIISCKSKKSIFIDDIGRIDYPKGTVVNPALDASHVHYPKRSNVTYLLGSQYIILRRPFLNVKRDLAEDNINNVIITMGGTDIRNLLPKIMTTVCQNYSDITFSIVLGSNSTYSKELLNANNENVKFYNNISGEIMSEIMMNSDIAITAAGQTIYELLATNTPFIPIKVIDNQKYTVKAIKDNKLAQKVLDWESTNLTEQIVEQFEILKEKEYRISLINKYHSFIDGKGVKRIINELMR